MCTVIRRNGARGDDPGPLLRNGGDERAQSGAFVGPNRLDRGVGAGIHSSGLATFPVAFDDVSDQTAPIAEEVHVERGFWQDRWQQGQIGFHKAEANALLQAHHEAIAKKQRVYVPLCGKSLDLVWLRDAGHDVVGCEFVGDAIAAFFAEQLPEVTVQRSTFRSAAAPDAQMTFHEGAGVRVVEGDALAVDTFATGGKVDAVWDRAALVALDPATRERYRDALLRVLADDGVILLVTFSYDQEKLPGPPWSVSDDDVSTLFGAHFDIDKVDSHAEAPGPKFVAAGVTDLKESVFVLRRRR